MVAALGHAAVSIINSKFFCFLGKFGLRNLCGQPSAGHILSGAQEVGPVLPSASGHRAKAANVLGLLDARRAAVFRGLCPLQELTRLHGRQGRAIRASGVKAALRTLRAVELKGGVHIAAVGVAAAGIALTAAGRHKTALRRGRRLAVFGEEVLQLLHLVSAVVLTGLGHNAGQAGVVGLGALQRTRRQARSLGGAHGLNFRRACAGLDGDVAARAHLRQGQRAKAARLLEHGAGRRH